MDHLALIISAHIYCFSGSYAQVNLQIIKLPQINCHNANLELVGAIGVLLGPGPVGNPLLIPVFNLQRSAATTFYPVPSLFSIVAVMEEYLGYYLSMSKYAYK